MALQLTPLMGTTAFPDRMADYFPELFKDGRIAQGHILNGMMNQEVCDAVNRDLADAHWRSCFHEALKHNNRFQHGLFDSDQIPKPEQEHTEQHSTLKNLTQDNWMQEPYTIEHVKTLSRTAHRSETGPLFEYGWALTITSASLVYTIQLCQTQHLTAATDSSAHFQLLTATCQRDRIDLANTCLKREGY